MGAQLKRKVVIQNRAGLHARPISKIVKLACEYDAPLTIAFDGQAVDGKSIFELMTLAAHCGAELELISEGEDSEALLDSIQELILSGFGEK